MKLLVLGGTIFVGRYLVEAALARGHEVTLFNRGRHYPADFPGVEKIIGDRKSDLSGLKGRLWDAVIDTSGYEPPVVRASAELLSEAVKHYTFVSSISVYSDLSEPGFDETAPLAALPAGASEELTVQNYGALKVLCEKAVEEAFTGRALHIRAGLIVGAYDYTDRFTYWPRRVAEGGEVLAPGNPDRRVQLIDVRDLAEWMVRMTESRQAGVYNATGPDYALTIGRLLEECKRATGSDARFVWVDDSFLLDQGVKPWDEVPLWFPEEMFPDRRGFMSVDCSKAIRAGLTFRPLTDTARFTLEWDATNPEKPSLMKDYGLELPEAGLNPDRERQVLEAWRNRGKAEG